MGRVARERWFRVLERREPETYQAPGTVANLGFPAQGQNHGILYLKAVP